MNRSWVIGLAASLLSVFSATPAVAARNVAPVITGTPATAVAGGSRYTFRPIATDANRDRIRFGISNKPSWASFDQRSGVLTGIPAAGLNATFSNIVITASDGRLSSSLAPFSIRVTSAVSDTAPVISGNPATSVSTSAAYSFRPAATDANGDALAFSVQNKPAWATFSTATGQLSGTTPSIAGTTAGIIISVSDGKLSAALPAFAINVVAPAATGTASLSWSPPTQNTDGSALTNLAGFYLYFGRSPSTLTQIVTIAGASATSYVLTGLSSGSWYFALSAYTAAGIESALSSVATKSFP